MGPDKIESVLNSFATSRLYDEIPHRFGFVNVRKQRDDVLFGFFVQEYPHLRFEYDDHKQEHKTVLPDFERYLFILELNRHYLYLQRRKRPHPQVPSWDNLFSKFVGLLRLVISEGGVHPPSGISEIKGGDAREEFIALFDNPEMRVAYLEIDGVESSLLPTGFRFFNPRVDLDAAYSEGMKYTSQNVRRATMEASDEGDLSKVPEARGYLHATPKPKILRVVSRSTSTVTTLQATRERKVEMEIDVVDPSETDMVAIIEGFQSQGMPKTRSKKNQKSVAGVNQPNLFDVKDNLEFDD